jgi:serine/threonine protein phosphatase PrpC
MSLFTFDAAIVSDVGLKRKLNQDRGLVRPDLGLFIVADGMGGHQGGEIASQMCVDSVEDTIRNSLEKSESENHTDHHLFQEALLNANQRVYDLSEVEPELKGMGTTATVLKISGNIATIGQVGDSRAYFWNATGIWQITRDHSLVEEKLKAGLISRSQVKTDGMKNVITRSVGYDPQIRVDLYSLEINDGDAFLLCSDGLTGPVPEQQIYSILESTLKSDLSLQNAAQRLIQAANEQGGDDNITAVLVQCKKGSS